MSSFYCSKSFPNDNTLDWFKLKAAADDKLKMGQVTKFVFDGLENFVRKGANAGNQHFLLFSQCFQMPCSLGLFKVGEYVVES